MYACPWAHLGDGKVRCQESCTRFTIECVFALTNQIISFTQAKGIVAIPIQKKKKKKKKPFISSSGHIKSRVEMAAQTLYCVAQ